MLYLIPHALLSHRSWFRDDLSGWLRPRRCTGLTSRNSSLGAVPLCKAISDAVQKPQDYVGVVGGGRGGQIVAVETKDEQSYGILRQQQIMPPVGVRVAAQRTLSGRGRYA